MQHGVCQCNMECVNATRSLLLQHKLCQHEQYQYNNEQGACLYNKEHVIATATLLSPRDPPFSCATVSCVFGNYIRESEHCSVDATARLLLKPNEEVTILDACLGACACVCQDAAAATGREREKWWLVVASLWLTRAVYSN